MKCNAFKCVEPCEEKCGAEGVEMCGCDFCENHIMRGDREECLCENERQA